MVCMVLPVNEMRLTTSVCEFIGAEPGKTGVNICPFSGTHTHKHEFPPHAPRRDEAHAYSLHMSMSAHAFAVAVGEQHTRAHMHSLTRTLR